MGRGSANKVMVVVLAILYVMAITQPAFAAVYNVGGYPGWTYNVASWPKGKPFRTGDFIVFKYNNALHNVVSTNRKGYNGCTYSKRTKVYRSGYDRIRLKKGANYFICAVPGHCQAGMKIAVTAK